MDTFTLDNIRAKYNLEVAYSIVTCGFEDYLYDNYIHTYDVEGNFLGWSLK